MRSPEVSATAPSTRSATCRLQLHVLRTVRSSHSLARAHDWGYGPAFATVRVYIEGQLRAEWTDVELVMGDMWDAFDIAWPSGDIVRVGGIIADYQRF